MRTYPIYFFILLMVLATCVFAQQIQISSIDDAIAQALEKNPDLESYKLNQEKAERDYKSVSNYRLPTISATFSGVNNTSLPVTQLPGELVGQPGTIVEATFGAKYNYNAGINISKNLLDFQAGYTSDIARVNMEIAEANHSLYKQSLAEQTALYYFTAIITQKAVDVQKIDFETSINMVELVEQKFSQGILDQYAVNRSRMNRNNISQNLNTYTILLEQCRSNLRRLYGLEPSADIRLIETFVSLNGGMPIVGEVAPDKSLELNSLQLKQADYRVKEQRAKWYPQISLTNYIGAQQYRDDFGMSFDSDSWSKVAYMSLNISIPIFNKFTTKNQYQSAIVDRNRYRHTLKQQQNESLLADQLLLKEYNYSKAATDAAKANFTLSRENADLQMQKFKQGIISLETYLDSFDDYLKAEVAYLNLLVDTYSYLSRILSRNI